MDTSSSNKISHVSIPELLSVFLDTLFCLPSYWKSHWVLIKSGNCGKTLLERPRSDRFALNPVNPVAIKPLSVKGIITSFRSSNTIHIRLIDSPWFFILTKLVVQGKLRIFSISFGRQGINLMGSREIFGFLSFVSSLINPVTCERPRFESDGC